jgi:hypothetical protein
MIEVANLLGLPIKFTASIEAPQDIWLNFLASDTTQTVLSIYRDEQHQDFRFTSGSDKKWAQELKIPNLLGTSNDFCITLNEVFVEATNSSGLRESFSFAEHLRGSEIKYMCWGKAIVPPLSLTPELSVSSMRAADPIDALPVEYAVLNARLERLEKACKALGLI